MTRPSFALSVATAAVLAAMSGAPASAITYDKLAYLTFTERVQVPGATLDAGTYRFRLADPDSSRNVVQVLSHDGVIVYALFFTMPDSRITVSEEATVTFREVPVGVTPPVKSLFYGGETRGYEFLYPRGGPDMTVHLPLQPAITSEPTPPAAPPMVAFQPAPAAAPVNAVVAEPAIEPESAPVLPATGSPLPLVAFGGMAALVLGIGAGLLRRGIL